MSYNKVVVRNYQIGIGLTDKDIDMEGKTCKERYVRRETKIRYELKYVARAYLLLFDVRDGIVGGSDRRRWRERVIIPQNKLFIIISR